MICFVRRCLLAAVAVGSLQISQSAADDPITEPVNCVRIGVTESLNRDTDPRLMLALIPPFRSMVSSCTGLECSLSDGGDAFQLATRLARGQLDFGIFQGIEFAWIQQKHPELIPCLTVVNSKPYLRACLVVPTCRQAAALSDLLKGSITVPLHSLDDAYEFLSKLCREQGLLPEKLLARLIQPSDAEEALDQVVEGMVPAAVVEEISLECYGRRKPGRFQRLGILQRSECFPATVIAYRAG